MKNIFKNPWVIVVIALAIGLIGGYFIWGGNTPHEHEDAISENEQAQVWTCAMHPQIRQNETGNCPICGMELIPLNAMEDNGDPMTVQMSETAMKLANVQTAKVEYQKPVKEVRMTGKVQPDERLVFSQTAHIPGRIEKLMVNFTGEYVQKGQPLVYIYSPDLVTAQEELFEAGKIKDKQPALFKAAKDKLKNWKLTEEQINEIVLSNKPRENFPILADVSGVVLKKSINLGDHVMKGQPIYDIADLTKVWLLLDVYESDMTWVKKGDKVQISINSMPGENFTGNISFIDPVIDPKTRVAKARVEMDNSSGQLKPEMFATGILKSELRNQKAALVIPKSAVMWTGERSVVYVKEAAENGAHFKLREVTLGPVLGDTYLVKEGLEEGEEIAVYGTFSIDAAAQLAGKPSMMNPSGGTSMTGHNHGDASAGAPTQAVSNEKAKAAVGKIVEAYLQLKDELVEDDLKNAKSKATQLKKRIEETDMGLFSGQSHELWMKHQKRSMDALTQMERSADLESMRKGFKLLSDEMVAISMTFGPFDKPVYIQRCPMADNERGADWLSDEEIIENPYFGASMLKCGEITKTIK